jgi:SHS2 domain-containing protein
MSWRPLPQRNFEFFAPMVEGGILSRYTARTPEGRRLLMAMRRRIAVVDAAHGTKLGSGCQVVRDAIVDAIYAKLLEAERVAVRARGQAASLYSEVPGVEFNDEDMFVLPDDAEDQGAQQLSPEEVLMAQDGAESATHFFQPHSADVCPTACGRSAGEALMNLVLSISHYMTDPAHPSMGIPASFEETAAQAKREADVLAADALRGDANLRLRYRRMRCAAFDITAPSLMDLIFHTMDTYLRVFQEHKLIFRHGRVISDVTQRPGGVFNVRFELAGTRFSRTRHVIGTEVKAITKHMMLLMRNNEVLLQSTTDQEQGDLPGEKLQDAHAVDAHAVDAHVMEPDEPQGPEPQLNGRQRAMRRTLREFREWYQNAVERAGPGADVYRIQLVVDI